MDLWPRRVQPCGESNLRICGDGPTRSETSSTPPTKPPHMRRWTPAPSRVPGNDRQTSAYAEMDLRCVRGDDYRAPNLRICGDGPQHLNNDFVFDTKPPHMRRWTQYENDGDINTPQTSAYAEMDLHGVPQQVATFPNLRICGDGPSAISCSSVSVAKPPHMRRWTRVHEDARHDARQTSAYAEMDRCKAPSG